MHSPLVVWRLRTRIIRGAVHTKYALLIQRDKSGSNLKTHSVSVHGWSVHVHEWCLYSIHVRVRTVPENTCCLYRQRDRPFFFLARNS